MSVTGNTDSLGNYLRKSSTSTNVQKKKKGPTYCGDGKPDSSRNEITCNPRIAEVPTSVPGISESPHK